MQPLAPSDSLKPAPAAADNVGMQTPSLDVIASVLSRVVSVSRGQAQRVRTLGHADARCLTLAANLATECARWLDSAAAAARVVPDTHGTWKVVDVAGDVVMAGLAKPVAERQAAAHRAGGSFPAVPAAAE